MVTLILFNSHNLFKRPSTWLTMNLTKLLSAGFSYFVVVFTIGFVFGTIRYILFIPFLGELLAVLMELPIMLFASAITCSWLIELFSLKNCSMGEMLLMGGVSFFLLMFAEFLLAVIILEQTLAFYIANLVTLVGLAGFSGQLAFALMPVILLLAK